MQPDAHLLVHDCLHPFKAGWLSFQLQQSFTVLHSLLPVHSVDLVDILLYQKCFAIKVKNKLILESLIVLVAKLSIWLQSFLQTLPIPS